MTSIKTLTSIKPQIIKGTEKAGNKKRTTCFATLLIETAERFSNLFSLAASNTSRYKEHLCRRITHLRSLLFHLL